MSHSETEHEIRPQTGHFFEKVLVFSLPISSALKGVMAGSGYYNSLVWISISVLFFLAIIFSRRASSGSPSTLTFLVILLGFYTLISRGFYISAQEYPIQELVLIVLSLPPLFWLMSVRLSTNSARDIMRCFVWGCAIAAAVGAVLSLGIITQSAGARAIWANLSMEVVSNRNDLALIYVLGLAACLLIDINIGRFARWSIITLLLFGILFSFSRSVYIALIGLYIIAFIMKKEYRAPIFVLLIVTFTAALVDGSPVGDRIAYTLQGRGGGVLDDSSAFRIYIWKSAIELFKSSPVFGVGAGHPPFISGSNYGLNVVYAHNYFITQLFQLGLVGFMLTLAMFYSFVLDSARQVRDIGIFGLAVCLIIVLVSLTGEPLYGASLYIFYIVVSAVTNKERD